MARVAAVASALVALACAAPALSSSGFSDELIWTREGWMDYALPLPWAAFKERTGEAVAVAEALPPRDDIYTSLDGPLGRFQSRIQRSSAHQIAEPGIEMSTLSGSLSEEQRQTLRAVCSCRVCLSLGTELWARAVRWAAQHRRRPSALALQTAGRELCEHEVPNALLASWMLAEARVNQGVPSLLQELGADAADGEARFYLLVARMRQNSTPLEIETVRAACNALLDAFGAQQPAEKAPGWGGGAQARGGTGAATAETEVPAAQAEPSASKDSVEEQPDPFATAQRALVNDHLLSALHRQLGEYLADSYGAVIEAEPGAPGIAVDRGCHDRHPQCEFWAAKGECEINPNYMKGPAQAPLRGYCRKACKICQSPDAAALPPPPPDSMAYRAFARAQADAQSRQASSADAEEEGLKSGSSQRQPKHSLAPLPKHASDAYRDRALLAGCAGAGAGGAPSPCTGAEALLGEGSLGAEASSAVLLEGLNSDSGAFFMGASQPNADRLALKRVLESSRVLLARDASDPVVSVAAGGGVTPPGPRALDAILAAAPTEAHAVASRALRSKCVVVSTGWWLYEVCPHWRVSQFHLTERHSVDWVIPLGRWEADLAAPGLSREAALYPARTPVPFVASIFGQGGTCELDAAEGGGRMVRRQTELRVMCSPDDQRHVAAKEPRKCVYVVELYLPEICAVEGMAPALGGEAPRVGGAAVRPVPSEDASRVKGAVVRPVPSEDASRVKGAVVRPVTSEDAPARGAGLGAKAAAERAELGREHLSVRPEAGHGFFASLGEPGESDEASARSALQLDAELSERFLSLEEGEELEVSEEELRALLQHMAQDGDVESTLAELLAGRVDEDGSPVDDGVDEDGNPRSRIAIELTEDDTAPDVPEFGSHDELEMQRLRSEAWGGDEAGNGRGLGGEGAGREEEEDEEEDDEEDAQGAAGVPAHDEL